LKGGCGISSNYCIEAVFLEESGLGVDVESHLFRPISLACAIHVIEGDDSRIDDSRALLPVRRHIPLSPLNTKRRISWLWKGYMIYVVYSETTKCSLFLRVYPVMLVTQVQRRPQITRPGVSIKVLGTSCTTAQTSDLA
jgi:hypothetical protein